MEGYRFQQFAYLVVPVTLGVEFFLTARADQKNEGRVSVKTVAMNAFGYVFASLIPLLFFVTIFSLEYKRLPLATQLLHRLDRYGVMFFFLGSWWQVFLITALRARRTAIGAGQLLVPVWLPYLVFGAFISALILWVAPWNLMWVSFFWFVATCGLFSLIGVSAAGVAKIFFILAVIVFAIENVLFVILDAIV